MSKRYIRSDFSCEESRFFKTGIVLCGEGNCISCLFKIVGRFTSLKEMGTKEKICDYHPEKDKKFKYENMGMTEIARYLASDEANHHISRKYIRNLSRKWKLTPVVLSLESDRIIYKLFSYIDGDVDLKMACKNYLSGIENDWASLMPIQFDFLSVRHTDQHKFYKCAGKIIEQLSKINM